MEKEEIKNLIKNVLQDATGISREQFKDDEYLLTGGYNIESIMMLEMMISLEDELGIAFDDNEMVAENFNSINAIADIIELKLNEL